MIWVGATMRRFVPLAGLLLLIPVALAPAQPKPPEMKDKPKLIVASPIGVAPGKTSKLTAEVTPDDPA